MKHIILATSLLFVFACKKDTLAPADTATAVVKEPVISTLPKDTTPATTATTDQSLISSGDFVTRVHTTVGTAKIYEDKKTKKLSLVLEGFKTDAGPDLRIYLAEDLKANNFIEVTDKVKNGDTTFEIPATFDAKKQMQVLIWCKQFSVLFGSASLK